MSVFESAYFYRTSDVSKGTALLNDAEMTGGVETLANGWMRLDVGNDMGQNLFRLAHSNSQLLLCWLYTQDHGWSFWLFDRSACVSKYDCMLSDCDTLEEMTFDDSSVAYDRMAELAPHVQKPTFLSTLKAICNPPPHIFADFENPPAYQFLDLLRLPRPLAWNDPSLSDTGFVERVADICELAEHSDVGRSVTQILDDSANDTLLGRWQLVREEFAGINRTNDPATEIEWHFKKGEVEFLFRDNTRQRWTYTVRNDTYPKQITLEFRWSSKASAGQLKDIARLMKQNKDSMRTTGIYKIEGASLHVCVDLLWKQRPSTFRTTHEGRERLVILSRLP